jgi:plasmid stabilization system protein ParE
MTRIELAAEVFDDLDRFFEFLAEFDADDAPDRISRLLSAIDVLQHSPLIGRPTRGGKRELVIGRGVHGYVALYRYVTAVDTVFILALRSQRESGYERPQA